LADIICNTSPIQYLHQLGLLRLLPALVERIIVPTAVLAEIEIGRENKVDLPDLSMLDWVEIHQVKSSAVLPSAINLGIGETKVLALALESKDAIVILDDLLASRAAERLGIKMIGTLGILLEAKRKNLISEIAPILNKLEKLRFRVSPKTKRAVLKLAGEEL